MNLLATPTRRAIALISSFTLSAVLVACGGGGSSELGSPLPGTAKASAASLYFTDDFSSAYDAVWISVARVTAVNAAGTEVELLAYTPSRRLNLPKLRDAGSWGATAQIPEDAVAVRVYVDAQAQLQQLNGSMLDVTLSAPGGYLSFRLEGWNRSSGVLALDFDLPRFSLQGTTLVAATRVASADDLASWNHRDAEIKGTVSAVGATSLTLDAGALGSRVFILDANTSFVSLLDQGWTPAVGDAVEVYANVSGQGTALQFSARVVKHRAGAPAASTEIKGLVGAVKGSVVTLNVDASRHGGPTGSLDIDLADARFKRGSLATVLPGVRLEVYLSRQGDSWVAKAVEVEGAAKPGKSNRSDYAELKGRVVSLVGTQLTLTPLHSERFNGTLPAGNLTVELAQAYFEKSALSCLLAGTPVELKGYLDATGAFQVVKVEGEGACAATIPVAGVKPTPGASAAALNGKPVEAKGAIGALRSGEFEMKVYRIEGLAESPASVIVRYNSSTLFKGTSAATLAAGQFMEVKGTLQDGVITAVKIERD